MLQSTTYIQRQRFVWIDAICINQDDIEERSSQVQMMSNIFERAVCIIGWLGQADDTTADAISVMERLSSLSCLPLSKADIGNMQRSFEHITQAEFFDPQAYLSKLGIRFITAAEWLAWVVFLSRPYFERGWIVQEVIIAKRIVLVCGRYIIPWNQLATASFFLGFVPQWGSYLNRGQMHNWVMPGSPDTSKFERMLVPEASESVLPVAAVNLVKIRTYARFDVQYGGVTPKVFGLYGLLECFRSTVATDPRDKIFALLSIADRTKAPFADPSASIILSPDYKLPTEVLFIRLTRLMIRCHGDLRIFQYRELDVRRRLRSLPSWVPDYSVAQIPDRLGSGLSNCDWKSSGDEKYYADGRELDDPLLSLQGRCISRVEKVSLSTQYTRPTALWGSIFQLLEGMRWQRFLDGRE
ncbi:heterokaryon incompatibility protein-domain-containing protein [Stachybotrys elegans]|uniref:Heterokaryon incompatibility protein-domain-containing protein n=1 Tax=Stachybotrys elegans TaxID=80388 RepID=A0A8K0WJL7_9HYPO|nr:heterokaryon incompatibility protein-domain-containing protein [Stachybotrys elegans]